MMWMNESQAKRSNVTIGYTYQSCGVRCKKLTVGYSAKTESSIICQLLFKYSIAVKFSADLHELHVHVCRCFLSVSLGRIDRSATGAMSCLPALRYTVSSTWIAGFTWSASLNTVQTPFSFFQGGSVNRIWCHATEIQVAAAIDSHADGMWTLRRRDVAVVCHRTMLLIRIKWSLPP